MTKKQSLLRWHCIKKFIETMGGRAELDAISERSIHVVIQTQQNLTQLIEWSFMEWTDVAGCGQLSNDGQRTFFVQFKPPKDDKYTPDDPDEKGED